MTKRKAELRLVFSDGESSCHALTVVLQGFDLYILKLVTPLAGKTSHHSSGTRHTDIDLMNTRIRSTAPEASLKGLKDFIQVGGLGAGSPPNLGDDHAKRDTKRRRTLSLPVPSYPWGVDVWAIEAGKISTAERIVETVPWKKSEISGYLLADWTDPLILMTVWQGVCEKPFEIIKYQPRIEGETRAPYFILPEKWYGTWLWDHLKLDHVPLVQALIQDEKRKRELSSND